MLHTGSGVKMLINFSVRPFRACKICNGIMKSLSARPFAAVVMTLRVNLYIYIYIYVYIYIYSRLMRLSRLIAQEVEGVRGRDG